MDGREDSAANTAAAAVAESKPPSFGAASQSPPLQPPDTAPESTGVPAKVGSCAVRRWLPADRSSLASTEIRPEYVGERERADRV